MLHVPTVKISKSAIGAITMICCLASPSLQAQGKLEEIIVTAQKREEKIQDVPISITNMTGDRLSARFTGGEDILALASAAPGLYVETSNGRLAPRFYLRGLGNADFTQAASQPVSLVFDEVPMENASFRSFPLFDLENIEIIRGPQGTLFGRNTTAGIVKVNTRRPTAEMEGYIDSSVGGMGTFNAQAALGGPLIDGVLMGRVSLMTQNRGDWIDNAFTGENDAIGGFNVFAGRVQFTWMPADNFTAWLMHQQQDLSGNSATVFRANVFDKGSNNLNENYDRETVYLDGGDNNPSRMKSHGTTLKLDWDVADYTLTSITSFQKVTDRFSRADIDGGFGCLFTCGAIPSGPPSTPFNPANSPFIVNLDTGGQPLVEQLTQELRLSSNFDSSFNYQVGVFFFDEEFDGNSQSQNAGATSFTVRSTSHIENTAWAAFGQGSYDLSDRLTVTAGIRYTDDEKDALHVDFSGVVPTVPISLSDQNVSWDLALSYAMSEKSQVYGRAATGFRAPTIQARIQDDVEVTTADSETILSYEVGYKASLERFRVNVATFYYVVEDMQLVAVGGGTSNTTSLLNANEGIGYGVELEAEYLAADNLILSGGFAYNETEINDETLSVPGGPLVTLLDPLDANGFALIDGNPFQHAPRWTANFELDYTYPLSERSELYLFTDWKFKGETQDFLYESIEYTFDPQFEGGLQFGYRNLEKNMKVGLFGRNITDEDNPIGGIDFANNAGYVNQPRVWGVEASYQF